MVRAYICRVPHRRRFTQAGKDFRPRSLQRGRVHHPPPDWALARLRVLGDRLRTCRRAAHLTQIQLGERIGRDHKTISRWENAHRVPSALDLIFIAHALNVSLAELVGE